MKLNVDLNELWSKVKEMGATERVVDVAQWIAAPPAEISTRSGGVVKEDTVQNVNGLLSADGTQVLLFMPKHGYYPIERSLIDPYNANKFHVTFCDKLEEMRSSNEYHKYRSTYNTSGMFEIFGISKSTGLEMRGEAKLNVCQKCLQKINYKGVNIRSNEMSKVVKEFDLAEFFSKYSSFFKNMPKQYSIDSQKGYTADWKQISDATRKQAGYICTGCLVFLKDHKYLLHTHHINRVKSDNSPLNLKVLCADCHRKQDAHECMYVKHGDLVQINKLRREQGLLDVDDWKEAFELVDPACHGILEYCKKKGFTIPEIGYEVTNPLGEVIADVEIAWPHKKFAVAIGSIKEIPGWRTLGMGQALEYFAQFGKH